MLEKLRFKRALKSESKKLDCKHIAEGLTTMRDMDFTWLVEAATNTVYVQEKSNSDNGDYIDDCTMQEVKDAVKAILTDDCLEHISSNACAVCSQGEVIPDGDAIFDSMCESEGLFDKIKSATGSLMVAVIIALIIKVIIWAIIYWWWNKKK